jgi:hypothetical protein
MEVAPATSPGGHIARRRFQASFGRTVDCMFWRIGFRQSSFRHITRVPLHPAPIRLRTVAVFLAGCHSLHLWVQVSHQTQEPPSKSLPTHRGYHQALRGAPMSPRYEGKPRIAETSAPSGNVRPQSGAGARARQLRPPSIRASGTDRTFCTKRCLLYPSANWSTEVQVS